MACTPCQKLVALDTQVMEQEVVRVLSWVRSMKLVRTFMNNIFHKHLTIEQCQCQTLWHLPIVLSLRIETKLTIYRLEKQLFLSLLSVPDAHIAEFFHSENQQEPPGLADHGSLRSGCKPNILEYSKAQNEKHIGAKTATIVVLDVVVVVHIVHPTSAKTLAEYATETWCHSWNLG